LQTRNQIPLLEFQLQESEWKWMMQAPENNPNKKNEWDVYSGTMLVKILCDSIQYNKISFQFSVYDDSKAETSPSFTSQDTLRLTSKVPHDYQYPKESEQRFHLWYSSNLLKANQIKRALGIPPKKIKAKMLDFQTVIPEKLNKKPLKISFEKNNSSTNTLQLWELKNNFFKDFDHWRHLWVIEVANTHPQAAITALEIQLFFWGKNGKLITDHSYHPLVFEHKSNEHIKPQSSKRYDLLTELGEKTVDGYPVPIRADEVGRYEIKVMRVAWARQ
jgi:hypothetical protein